MFCFASCSSHTGIDAYYFLSSIALWILMMLKDTSVFLQQDSDHDSDRALLQIGQDIFIKEAVKL